MRSELVLAVLWMCSELRCPTRDLHIYLQKLIKERTNYAMKTKISLA